MGRAVYEGVYQPGHSTADENGFRQDTLKAVKGLGATIIRYPGGNYVSFADWKDGIGDRNNRPRRPDFAWRSIETNHFGTDDFIKYCKVAGFDPMMAVNLGTGSPKEAAELVEFCNLKRGTYWADQRAEDEPYDVKFWCLGNEMDGPWQAGQVPAKEYALKARAASRLMKGMDPTIKTALSGSSNAGMDTYMEWDREVLEICWDDIDYIACHQYSQNHQSETEWFLAEGFAIEKMILDYKALVRTVGAQKKKPKDIKLSFDEWNVWYKAMQMDGGWTEAPHLIEEVYNLEDALVVATILNAFIRNCDFLAAACLAQLVNVIAPILTNEDGVLIQSTYYPFSILSNATNGASRCDFYFDGPTTNAGKRGDVPILDIAAFTVGDELRVSAVNLSTTETVALKLDSRNGKLPSRGMMITGTDPKTANTFESPNQVIPVEISVGETVQIPPLTFVYLGG